MVKLGARPAVEAMALFAGGGKAAGHVTGTGGRLVLLGVAGITLGRQTLKLSGGRPLVTCGAIEGRVGAQQRKAVLVLVDLLRRNLPALYAVALLAVRSELPFVDVSMTIRALVAHIAKYRFHVALGARDLLMHAAQWVAGLAMVELRRVPDGLPAAEGVAVLARDIQRTVRAAGVGIGLRLCRSGHGGEEQDQREKSVPSDRRNQRSTA